MFLDSHCHLDLEHFKDDLPEVIKRAREAGVTKIIANGGTRESNQKALDYAKQFPEVECILGIDPNYYQCTLEDEIQFVEERKKLICGIGEIGLDHYHFNDPEEWKEQELVFEGFLELASKINVPVEVHTRNAEERVFEILPSYPCKVVLHCFLKSKMAGRAEENGWMVSLPTVKSSDRETIIDSLSLESLLCETDAPFLWKDGRNEPANVLEVYREIAARKHVAIEEVRDSVWRNAKRIFAFKKVRA